MAGIEPVPGYGDINAGNAKEIYKAYKRGEVDLTTSQAHYAESFLSEDDWDEIEYDTGSSNKSGHDQVSDAQNAENHGGQGGNVMLTSAPAAIMSVLLCIPWADGFSQALMSVCAVATGVLGNVCAKAFDNGYNDRCGAKDNADSTNEVIDAHTDTLEESMDMMNEDMETYKKDSDELTFSMNDTAAQIADLKQQLADAEAIGNAKKAADLRKQIQALESGDFEEEQGKLDETKEHMDEYASFNAESIGVADAGVTVSDFLKEGLPLGIMAALNAVFYTVVGFMAGTAAAGANPKMAPFFPDAAGSLAAKISLGVAAALYAAAAAQFASKSKNEFQCYSAGGDMQGHANSLYEMIEQQQQYMDTTTENYDGVDEEAGEAQEQGQEAAQKVSASGGTGKGTKKEEEEEETKPKV